MDEKVRICVYVAERLLFGSSRSPPHRQIHPIPFYLLQNQPTLPYVAGAQSTSLQYRIW